MSNSRLGPVVVTSPLQILGATEARGRWGTDGPLVIFENDAERANEQMDLTAELLGWQNIVKVPAPKAGARRRVNAARKLQNKIGKNARYGFGDYTNPIIRDLVADSNSPVLYDDGIGTSWVPDVRAGRQQGFMRQHRFEQARHRASKIWRLRTRHPQRITYYSYQEIDPGPGDDAFRHDFPVVRDQFPSPPIDDTAIFLGTSLVEAQLFDEALFVEAVAAIASSWPGRFCYVPHRRESHEKLSRLQEAAGCDIRLTKLPIELELLRSSTTPALIAGFYTSAFHSLSVVLPEGVELHSYRLPNAGYRRHGRERAESIYDTMHAQTRGRTQVRDIEAAT